VIGGFGLKKSIPALYWSASFFLLSSIAHADAFIPTMVSANVLWVFVLPLVVVVEGWFMARRGWSAPYKNAILGNLLSMLAALPVGLALSTLGQYVASESARQSLSFVPKGLRFGLAQVLLYGQLPAPTYGFIDSFNGFGGIAGIVLAAIAFMGICWLVSIGVEGYFYARKNPKVAKSTVYGVTALAHLVSYTLLVLLWLPYSYHAAKANEDSVLRLCANPMAWDSNCPEIFLRYPQIRQTRLDNCKQQDEAQDTCLRLPAQDL
jgi:hypothetical protein